MKTLKSALTGFKSAIIKAMKLSEPSIRVSMMKMSLMLQLAAKQ